MQEFKLYAMHLWVTTKQAQGLPTNSAEFTNDLAVLYAAKLVHKMKTPLWWHYQGPSFLWQRHHLDKFWKGFLQLHKHQEENRLHFFGLHYAGIWSSCPWYSSVWQWSWQDGVDFLLGGPAFEKNNDKVWTAPKDLCLKGPSWAYISHFDRARNGGGALQALKARTLWRPCCCERYKSTCLWLDLPCLLQWGKTELDFWAVHHKRVIKFLNSMENLFLNPRKSVTCLMGLIIVMSRWWLEFLQSGLMQQWWATFTLQQTTCAILSKQINPRDLAISLACNQ